MRNRLHEIVPPSAAVSPVDVVIEPSLAGKGLELLERAQLADRQSLLVCDQHTFIALGERLSHEMGSHLRIKLLESPHADQQTVDSLRKENADAYIAVGSGTINDLCKYASFLDEKPYVVFPTAPSMNGYLSANASISSGHFKQTLKAHMPKSVFCDLSVLAAAPMRLICSGLGDSLCRTTAQADWLLSHLLIGTPYDPLPFSWLEAYEADLIKNAQALAARKPFAIELLLRTLLASGLGMTFAGGSYPASQGEHMLAHAMELKSGESRYFHGEQIGVTTLVMSELQQRILTRPVRLRRHSDWLKTALDYFGESHRDEIGAGAGAKFTALSQRFEEINEILSAEKNHLADALHHVMLPTEQLQRALIAAGGPTKAEDIGWQESQLSEIMPYACLLRDRFTFLDLL